MKLTKKVLRCWPNHGQLDLSLGKLVHRNRVCHRFVGIFGAWNWLGMLEILETFRCSKRRQLGHSQMNRWNDCLKGRTAMEMFQKDEWQRRISASRDESDEDLPCSSRVKLLGWL